MASTARRRGAYAGRDAGGDSLIQRRYFKLIQQVEVEPTIPNIQLVVDFLGKEQWYWPVEYFVDTLDASLIPPVPFQNITAITTIDEADTAIASSVTLFRCLLHVSTKTPQIETYIQHAFDLLLERWASVIKWMAFIVMHCAISIDPKKVLQHCTDVLLAILSRASESPAKQELVSTTGTVDLVYLLFCQTDKMGRYYVIRSSEDAHEHCALTELFCSYFMESSEGWEAIQSRLKAVGKGTRKQILEAISGRANSLADEAEASNVSGYAASFNYLARGVLTMGSDEQVWAHLSRARVAAKLSSALGRLMDKADGANQECWEELSNTTLCIAAGAITFAPNPTASVVSLAEGGLFGAAMRCLPHLGNSRGAYQTLELMVPHMYLRKALMEANARGDLAEVVKNERAPENLKNPKAVKMWKLANFELGRVHGAHCGGWKDAYPSSLCSSAKHFKRHPRSSDDLELRTCSHCHWVTYCSPECQRDDWAEYHWLECRMAATRGHAQFLDKAKNIVEIRRSQIICLEYAVNEPGYMSSYHSLLPSSPLPHTPAPPPYDAFDDPHACSILKVPLGVPNRNSRPIPIINFATKCVPLSPKLDPTKQKVVVPEFKDDHANEWEQRYRGFMREVESQRVGRPAEPNGSTGHSEAGNGSTTSEEPSDGELRLVEGHFWYVDMVAMRTLVKVQYHRGRWRVVGSLFRLVLNRIEGGYS